jgi:hypothetical protein
VELEQSARERILLEEQYRHEIREKLSEPKSDGRLKKFLNSSFGLWLLSAIFVSGAGTLYQHWQKQSDEEKVVLQKKLDESAVNREAISRLDVEISYRISTALLELSSVEERVKMLGAEKTDNERKLMLAQTTFGVLRSLGTKERAARDGLYPEYSNYTLPTSFAELRRRLPESERAEVESSLASFAALSNSMQFKKEGAPPYQVGESLFSKVILKRWQGTAFHHVDCNASSPFC